MRTYEATITATTELKVMITEYQNGESVIQSVKEVLGVSEYGNIRPTLVKTEKTLKGYRTEAGEIIVSRNPMVDFNPSAGVENPMDYIILRLNSQESVGFDSYESFLDLVKNMRSYHNFSRGVRPTYTVDDLTTLIFENVPHYDRFVDRLRLMSQELYFKDLHARPKMEV